MAECKVEFNEELMEEIVERKIEELDDYVNEEKRKSYKEGYLDAVHAIILAFTEVDESKINRETIIEELKELHSVKDIELDECVTKEE